jgi:hypothetical protein
MKVNLKDAVYITETKITIRGSRRRTTVPKTIVDMLQLKDGEKMRWVLMRDSSVILFKVGE